MPSLSYDSQSFIWNGNRLWMIGVNVEYALLAPERWRAALLSLKQMGFNTIEPARRGVCMSRAWVAWISPALLMLARSFACVVNLACMLYCAWVQLWVNHLMAAVYPRGLRISPT
jgi:hypothetical protein